jgi:Apolipoprotein A1/A4/E domain
MANTPKKIKDPTEAALSAIQDALSIRDEVTPDSQSSAAPAMETQTEAPVAEEGSFEPPWRRTRPAPTEDQEFAPEVHPPQEQPALRRPANDDRESIGQILRSLQRSPARTSYQIATVFAIAWVVVGLILGWMYLPQLEGALSPTGLTAPVLAVLAAIFLAPIIFFYALAHMAWRSQELRLITQSMAEVAMRLAEPETIARESIVTVGQAIRREVAAMGDGVERALARAGELEALVANEVSALEHAYNDNEVRIRALLQDLGSQRDTLVGQAAQIRDAINSVHLDLGHDISQINELVAEQVNEASRRITHTLAEKAEHITRALGHAGDTMIQSMGERGGDLLKRLETTSRETAQAIAGASDRLASTLNFKTDHIGDEFTEITANLQHMMSVRLERITEGFAQKSAAVLDMMTNRSQEMTDLAIETGNQLAETISGRIEEVNTTLKNTGDSLVLDLSLRGGDVVSKLEQTGARITDTILQRSQRVSDELRDSVDSLGEMIGNRGDAVREMIAARLQSFEDMFNHGGAELAERIARDSTTLGNLITRHLAEFDRTVKTYGGEMVERLGERTQEISAAMRDYLDNFDTRVTTKSAEVTASLDQQFARFGDSLDGRAQTLNEALGSRVLDIAKTMAEGGKEVVGALDKRIADVTDVINVRGAKLAESIGEKIDDIDKALGVHAMEVANNLDTRIGRFEELLVGRAETVTGEIEARTQSAAELLAARTEHLSGAIKSSAGEAAQALEQLTNSTTQSLSTRVEQLSTLIKTTTAESERSIGNLTHSASNLIGTRLQQLSEAIKTDATEAERLLSQVTANTTAAIRSSTHDAERLITGMSTGVSNVLKQNAGDVERTLLALSAEVARNFVGKADEISTAVSQRAAEMTRIIDDKSSGLLGALTAKSQEFAVEVGRVTEHAVKAIEVKGFTFTQTMMDNSEQIARLINEASHAATGAVSQSLQQLQSDHSSATQTTSEAVARSVKELRETAEMATQGASKTIARTLRELQDSTQAAVEQSKQSASAAVSEILETQNMLRSDTTALFERLREANILLQEVLSGAHENMSEIESTLVTRVADFVSAMNEVAQKTGTANSEVERNITGFQTMAAQTISDLTQLATQFDVHGRSLAEAVALIDTSNRRTEGAITERRNSLQQLIATLEEKSNDLEQRLTRFASVLDESLEGATDRAREIARLTADATTGGARAIAESFESIRSNAEDERKRTGEALHAIYEEANSEANTMFAQAAQRFADVLQGLKSMASEMQHELETTRAELRRGVLELPQETADSAAQMRRVIVDQIEALAELNRIVARHGRGMDAVEPAIRRAEPMNAGLRRVMHDEAEAVLTNGGPRAEQPRQRADITGVSAPAIGGRRAEAPPVSPAQPAVGGRAGWLSELLTRASQEPEPAEPAVREAPQESPRAERSGIDSLDSLAVDIARMIDHDAAAELWERYNRGERNVFSRKLYTPQGQRAFEEIRKKYRSDRDFTRTVDRYISEFERLLEEVSRDDRGQVVARTYLTSETGKVYTLLAHAAGRFE